MQSDIGAIEIGQNVARMIREVGIDDHATGRRHPAGGEQFANAATHARRKSVIVGAKDDALRVQDWLLDGPAPNR
jgi:hypothetical protein